MVFSWRAATHQVITFHFSIPNCALDRGDGELPREEPRGLLAMSSADRDKTSYIYIHISYYSSDDLVLSLNIQRLCLWCLWKEMMFSWHSLSHLILLMTIKIQESRMSFSAGDPHFRLGKTEQTWQVLHLGTTVGEVPPPSLASKNAKSRSFRDFDSTLLSFSGLIDSCVPRMHCISYQITSVFICQIIQIIHHACHKSFKWIFANFCKVLQHHEGAGCLPSMLSLLGTWCLQGVRQAEFFLWPDERICANSEIFERFQLFSQLN